MEKARELLLKHLYNHGGDGLGIQDGKIYMAVLDAIQEALKISSNPVLCDENCIKKCSCGRELHPTFYCDVCDNDE
jgi:hypothetical protein